MNKDYDVIIIGGGPAGISAALTLGRSMRRVIICDAGNHRNAKAEAMNGFISRDGIKPTDFRKICLDELKKYNVKIEKRTIAGITREDNHFKAFDDKGNFLTAKKILIATGIIDNIPALEGIDDLYGKSVHHCPYCDGWEVRDKKLAVYGKGKAAYMLSFSLKTWSSDVIICTDGWSKMREADKKKLEEGNIKIYTDKIIRLDGTNGRLERIIFNNNESIEREALFFTTGSRQHSELAKELGCRFSNDGYIRTNRRQETGVPGVFVAGDAAKDMKFVIVAAAEGARAGVAINISLQEDERKRITDEVPD